MGNEVEVGGVPPTDEKSSIFLGRAVEVEEGFMVLMTSLFVSNQ